MVKVQLVFIWGYIMDTSDLISRIRSKIGVDGLILIVVILVGVVVATSLCTKTDEESSDSAASYVGNAGSIHRTV